MACIRLMCTLSGQLFAHGVRNLTRGNCLIHNFKRRQMSNFSKVIFNNRNTVFTVRQRSHECACISRTKYFIQITRRGCQSEASDSKPDPRKTARRNRIIAYLGGFVLIHLCVVWGRRFYKNQDPGVMKKATQSSVDVCEYVDPDLGKTAKMFYYKDYLLPFFAKDSVQQIEEFSVRDSDVFVSSFPKSGTTWVQEIVYQIVAGLDMESAPDKNMEQRFPFLEFVYPGVREVARQRGQRLIKTHMPHSLLPVEARAGKGKVIYVARNPKDVSVSYFHYVRMLSEVAYDGNYQGFFEKFINDKVAYGPWWKHVVDYWNHREDSNILFLTYEELQQDLLGSVKKVAQFLGRPLTPAQAAVVVERCTFKAMKRNPDTNYSWWDDLGLRRAGESVFMRKGVVGDWHNYCTTDMAMKVDDMCARRLEPAGLRFVDDLK